MLNQNIDVYADVIKAFAEGKKIQWMNIHSTSWQDWNEFNDIPEYNAAYRYRVKPKLMTIRLYKDCNGRLQVCEMLGADYPMPDLDWISDSYDIELY